MRKSFIIFGSLAIALIIALTLYFTLRHTDDDGHDHAEGEKKAEAAHAESAIKEVELNEAQYNASKIVLGSFEMKNLSEVINANGYTKLPPQNQADVSVYMGGVVKSIFVIEGQSVTAGQSLATLQSPEFAKLQESYSISKTAIEFLTLEYDRQKTLSDANVNAKKTFQKVKSDLETETARLQSLEKQISLLNLGGGSAMSIVAPISGSITDVNIKIGSNVEPNKPLFSIVDNSKMHVDLLVYEKDFHKVKTGQTVRFVLTNQNNAELKGKIFSVGKAFENETKSVAVHADILNDKQMLISGMYVNAVIDVGSQPVAALPIDAVVKADGREFIFILEEEGHEEEGHKEEEHAEKHDEEAGHSHDDGHDHADEHKTESAKPHDEEAGHSHDDGHEHKDEHGKEYHFQRIEVKTGVTQLGYVQVTVLQTIEPDAQIVLKGAYYIQSHLVKSEGGGGHEH